MWLRSKYENVMSKTKDHHTTSQQVTLGVGARLPTRVKQNT
jgi:hypothetical protein